jgi:phospholipid-translocating ATPase
MVIMSAILIILQGQNSFSQAMVSLLKFIVLLSSIIPISMRVNLDFAKLMYTYLINTDNDIKDTIARNSNIPEELGRIEFLLSDKTGTLT